MERNGTKSGATSTVVFVVVAAAGLLLATRWAHVVAALARHSTLGEAAIEVVMAAVPVIAYGLLSDRPSLRGLLVASWVVLAWVVGTQSYLARAWRDPGIARAYHHVAPGYPPGLGVWVVMAVLALFIRAAVRKHRTEPPVGADQPA